MAVQDLYSNCLLDGVGWGESLKKKKEGKANYIQINTILVYPSYL
jgi:hypothetical protein